MTTEKPESESEAETPEEILQKLKRIAGEWDDWNYEHELKAIFAEDFKFASTEKTLTDKSKVRDGVKKEYQEARARLNYWHEKSFSTVAAQACIERLEKKEQEISSLLQLIRHKYGRCDEIYDVVNKMSIEELEITSRFEDLLENKLFFLHHGLKKETRYLARLKFKPSGDAENYSEIIQEIHDDLQSVAEEYAYEADRVLQDLAWHRYALPLHYFVRAFTAKLELPQ
jgi:hypothetical protein